ncbi:hypothetical protein BMF35_a0603 [Aurantiacibacter gangjinensis]|nr:hypothetical protein BMF35_a0603 [Aurantiacibacter gangjinensis]
MHAIVQKGMVKIVENIIETLAKKFHFPTLEQSTANSLDV